MKMLKKSRKTVKPSKKAPVSNLEEAYKQLLPGLYLPAKANFPDDEGSLLQPSPYTYVDSINSADVSPLVNVKSA